MLFIRKDGSAGANFSFARWPYAAGARCPGGYGIRPYAVGDDACIGSEGLRLPRVPAGYKTSMEFCLALIDKAGVICTPGSSFGPSGEGYVRFALTMPVEKIGEAVQAIKNSGILG